MVVRGAMEAGMDTDTFDDAQFEVLEAAIHGIHSARLNHRILSTFTTRADSVMLAQAALEAIEASGFRVVRDAEA
jgi:hypothetical protein